MGTTENVTLKELSMGQFRTGPIWLLPYGDGPELPEIGPNFPKLADDVTPSFSTYPIVTDGKDNLPANSETPLSHSFYQYETGFTEDQTMADNAFTISVKAGSKELTDYEIDYDWMRRNDFLTIPIYISNIRDHTLLERIPHADRRPAGEKSLWTEQWHTSRHPIYLYGKPCR